MSEVLRFSNKDERSPITDGALALKGDTPGRPSYLWATDTSKEQIQSTNISPFESKKEKQRTSMRKVVQYEIDFDLQRAQGLRDVKLYAPERYEEGEKAFEGFIRMQLLTALGERYNRGISEFSYRTLDGKLVGEHSDEPFEEVLIRGRDYRKEHGDPIDHPREEAEVVGFQKMQEVMVSEETPAGTVMLTISPPGEEGSIYKHNFYDGYRKNEDGSIQAVRFSSALTPEETIMRLWEIDPEVQTPEDSSDVTLLSNPILLKSNLTLAELHQRLHLDHDVLSEEDFEKVQQVSEVLITSYIATLKKHPENEQQVKEVYNALLNQADDAADALKQKTYDRVFGNRQNTKLSDHEFYDLAYRPVRQVDTGCGASGGMELGDSMSGLGMGSSFALGPFSVSEFSFGERKLKCKECPVCHAKDIVATISHGKITCPECNASEKYDC